MQCTRSYSREPVFRSLIARDLKPTNSDAVTAVRCLLGSSILATMSCYQLSSVSSQGRNSHAAIIGHLLRYGGGRVVARHNPRPEQGDPEAASPAAHTAARFGAKTAYIERGSPWENGYIENFNARLRDELLNGEIFYTLREAQIVIESWRRHYNAIRPHTSLEYKPPAPEAFVPVFAAWPAALRRPAPPTTLAQPPTLN